MKRAACILGVGLMCVAVATITLDCFGEHRIFGYEVQVDMASAKVRRFDYALFFKTTVTVETNGVAKLAEAVQPNAPEHWVVAVKRPFLRRRSEELGGAKLLSSIKILDAFLHTESFRENQKKELVARFLETMATKSPSDVSHWLDAQQALNKSAVIP